MLQPGWKTSEFWLTASLIVIAAVIALVAMFHGAGFFEKAVATVPIVLAFLKTHSYAVGRVKQKLAALLAAECSPTPPAIPPTPIPAALEPPKPVIVPPVALVTPKTPARPVSVTVVRTKTKKDTTYDASIKWE